MTRVIRGMTGLLLVATVAACNNDPGVDLSGDPTQIQATPQVMIINQGATEQLLLRLTDDANFSVPAAPYTISDVGPGLTVTFDDTYRPDYTTGVLKPREFQSQHRYTVTATQAVGTSFKVSNGGISQVITVKVIPSSIPASLGASTVAPGQSTTLTAGNGFSFGEEATFTWNAGGTLEIPALVLDRAVEHQGRDLERPTGVPGEGRLLAEGEPVARSQRGRLARRDRRGTERRRDAARNHLDGDDLRDPAVGDLERCPHRLGRRHRVAVLALELARLQHAGRVVGPVGVVERHREAGAHVGDRVRRRRDREVGVIGEPQQQLLGGALVDDHHLGGRLDLGRIPAEVDARVVVAGGHRGHQQQAGHPTNHSGHSAAPRTE